MLEVDIASPPDNYALPNDEATTAACLTYFLLKSIPFKVRYLRDAYFASPDGLLPLSNICGNLVSGFMSMVFTLKTFNGKNEVELDAKVLEMKNTHHIFFFWVADTLRNLTLYLTWVEPNGERHTRDRFNSMYPWPLGDYYCNRQKKLILKFLTSADWASDGLGDVLKRFDTTCKHISCMITDGPFVFNRKKCGKVDCLIAAYFNTFSTNAKYFAPLTPIISKYPSLTKLATSVRSLH
ncbi:Metaxin-2 [Echinococcus granulosus]|uniref:Metaxin 2 n=1 Tax=Echinococcus granulosus TaxID=6210 RepID=A0A068WC77_ECHGR|nr:Metaxin-2 [Echinococcus granulosus]CDS15198.1 metaxin 2 [Echinococcus granulosus]